MLLAVEAMEHAARRNMSKAILFAGDLDFEPLVNSLVRLGVPTRLVYVNQHTAKPLMRAADEIKKVTLFDFYDWAAPSFKSRHAQVAVRYGELLRPSDELVVVREGQWNGRLVQLLRRPTGANPLLYVSAGEEFTEASYTIEHPDQKRLELAFNLTFGDITWKDTPALSTSVASA